MTLAKKEISAKKKQKKSSRTSGSRAAEPPSLNNPMGSHCTHEIAREFAGQRHIDAAEGDAPRDAAACGALSLGRGRALQCQVEITQFKTAGTQGDPPGVGAGSL